MQLAAVLRRAGAWRGAEQAAWADVPAVPHAGAPDGSLPDAVEAAWSGLAPARRLAVLDPTLAAADARQTDATTCGSAVLTMLAAIGDPGLALWLVTGTLAGTRPPELAAASSAALARLADAPAPRRFAAVQRVYQRRATAGALLGLPWPAALGTPPWGAAHVARFPGVAYGHHPLDAGDDAALRRALDGVGRAVDAGVPVPLYSGGDSADGWATAVPRHVVLAVGRTAEGLRIFEPGAGAVVTAPEEALLGVGGRRAALGGWSRLVWVLPPRRA